MNFRYRLMQFFSGRYGTDATFFVMIISASVLSLINIFLRSFFLQLLVYTLVLLAILRSFSRNFEARRRENAAVVNFISDTKTKMQRRRQRRKDSTHIYKKCPHCRAVLRLPRRKGLHSTVCPRCNFSFKVRVFRE